MNMSDLDYGAESGIVSNTTLSSMGIDSISYSKVMSDESPLTHITATTTDGKEIDLGNYDLYTAREMIKNAVFTTKEGFKQLFEYVDGEI